MFEPKGLRHALPQLVEPLHLQRELITPGVEIDVCECLESPFVHRESAPVDIPESRHPAERGFHRASATVHALDDPLEHAHVFSEAGPHELASLVATEPVDAEDMWPFGERASQTQP